MRIFIDIGHPAHVHYFKNFIYLMEKKGHIFYVTARDKDVTQELLRYYRIEFSSRGKGKKGLIGKIIYILEANRIIYKCAKRFNPDLFLSFGSPYAAHVSKLLNKPHIALDDTEHAKFEHIMYVPFSDVILTPTTFKKNLGKKQIFFNGYMELCYLNKRYFNPIPNVKEILGLKEKDQYIIIRFVSWGANHDLGQKGFSIETKYRLIEYFKNNYKIFISSEKALPDDLQKYYLKISPHELHSVLMNASLYIGEGSTTASECSVLGVPNIYVNSLTVGYCTEQDIKYNLCKHIKNDERVFEEIDNIVHIDGFTEEWQIRRDKMLSEKIDVTAFMVWFVENYPQSFKVMKENPNYQYNFR